MVIVEKSINLFDGMKRMVKGDMLVNEELDVKLKRTETGILRIYNGQLTSFPIVNKMTKTYWQLVREPKYVSFMEAIRGLNEKTGVRVYDKDEKQIAHFYSTYSVKQTVDVINSSLSFEKHVTFADLVDDDVLKFEVFELEG